VFHAPYLCFWENCIDKVSRFDSVLKLLSTNGNRRRTQYCNNSSHWQYVLDKLNLWRMHRTCLAVNWLTGTLVLNYQCMSIKISGVLELTWNRRCTEGLPGSVLFLFQNCLGIRKYPHLVPSAHRRFMSGFRGELDKRLLKTSILFVFQQKSTIRLNHSNRPNERIRMNRQFIEFDEEITKLLFYVIDHTCLTGVYTLI